MKNESYWEEIEGLPPFQEASPQYSENWVALEKFQKTAAQQLNAVSLLALDALLRRVYAAGVAIGQQSKEG